MVSPAWLGIGAQRSGTTWFTDLLTQHPQVGLGTNGKKEQHLLHKVADGREPASAYLDLFPDDGVRRGEWTPQSLRHASAPAAAARLVPDAPVLVLLRDPVERFRSAMRLHATRLAATGKSSWPYPVPITVQTWTGFYADQLAAWAHHVGRDRMRVMVYETVRADPQTCRRRGLAAARARAGRAARRRERVRLEQPAPTGTGPTACGSRSRSSTRPRSRGSRTSGVSTSARGRRPAGSGPGPGRQLERPAGELATGRARGARRPGRACGWPGSRRPSRPAPRRAPTSPRTTPRWIGHRQLAADDVGEPGLPEQPDQVSLARARRTTARSRRRGRARRPRPRTVTAARVHRRGPTRRRRRCRPCRVTRAISARPRDRVLHEVHDELGDGARRRRRRRRAGPRRRPRGRRHPAAARGRRRRSRAAGSIASTRSAPYRSTSTAVRTPGPQPTSSTRPRPGDLDEVGEQRRQRLGEAPHEPCVGTGVTEGHGQPTLGLLAGRRRRPRACSASASTSSATSGTGRGHPTLARDLELAHRGLDGLERVPARPR